MLTEVLFEGISLASGIMDEYRISASSLGRRNLILASNLLSGSWRPSSSRERVSTLSTSPDPNRDPPNSGMAAVRADMPCSLLALYPRNPLPQGGSISCPKPLRRISLNLPDLNHLFPNLPDQLHNLNDKVFPYYEACRPSNPSGDRWRVGLRLLFSGKLHRNCFQELPPYLLGLLPS